jgi:hypothetical protein
MKHVWIWLLPLLLLTAWMGTRGLDANAIWFDEYWSIYDAGGAQYGPLTPLENWERVATRNPWHTPGFFIALNGWGRLVGWEPPALRVLSLLLGLLAVAWTYRLGRDTLSQRAGLLAAVVLGSSSFFAYYLHQIRMYSLIALLTALTLWLYLRIMDSRRRPPLWAWACLFLCTLATLYTHYLAALPLAVIGLYHLLLGLAWALTGQRPASRRHALATWRFGRRWWGATLIMGAAGALFLPWLGVLQNGLARVQESEALQSRVLDTGQLLEELFYLFANGSPLLLWLTALGAGLALLLARRRGRIWRAWFLALGLMGLVLLVNAALGLVPVSRIRYLISLWPLLAVVAGLGISALASVAGRVLAPRWERVALAVLAGGWIGAGILSGTDRDFIRDLGGAGNIYPLHWIQRAFDAEGMSSDFLINYLPPRGRAGIGEQAREFYTEQMGIDSYTLFEGGDAALKAREHAAVAESAGEHERVWLAYMPQSRPLHLDELVSRLDERYELCRVVVDAPRLRLDLYARSPVCCQPNVDAPRIRFSGVALVDYAPPPAAVDDVLPLTLVWSVAEGVPIHEYSVGLHVFNAAGEKVAQADYGLPPTRLTCRETTLDMSALPPGEYTVSATVYAWQTGERVVGTTADGATGDMLPILTFRVER